MAYPFFLYYTELLTMFNAIKNNRGQIMIPATVFWILVIILGFGALAVDIGYFYHVKNELQVAADAAASAGAIDLDGTNNPTQTISRNTASLYAGLNTAAGNPVLVSSDGTSLISPSNDITVGFWDTSTGYNAFSAGTLTINAVQVRTRRTADSPGGGVGKLFGRIFSSVTTDISATAVATAVTSTHARLVQ
jgi:uncharacterized membrane protein